MSWGRGSTRQSRKIRAIVLTRHPVCHLQYDGCTQHSTRDDHVVPLAEGGSDGDDLSNHRGACAHCHDVKSAAEAARGRARVQAKAHHPYEGHPGAA